ncbi:hypothetical protein ACA910_008296 [Epithemia clementina (nom. ined.)]
MARMTNGEEGQDKCRWYEWGCRDGQGNGGGQGEQAPWWYFSKGGEVDDEGGVNPALVFIYIWSMLLFGFILHHGLRTLAKGKTFATVVMLAVFANVVLISMFFLGGLDGAIDVDGRQVEQYGWYGQLGVLMYLTNSFWLIFAGAFIIILILPRENPTDNNSNINQQNNVYTRHGDEEELKRQEERRRNSIQQDGYARYGDDDNENEQRRRQEEKRGSIEYKTVKDRSPERTDTAKDDGAWFPSIW